jgi:hypothetical protein
MNKPGFLFCQEPRFLLFTMAASRSRAAVQQPIRRQSAEKIRCRATDGMFALLPQRVAQKVWGKKLWQHLRYQ